MKKIGYFAIAALVLSSCETAKHTATTANVESALRSLSVADLKVGDRVSVDMKIDKSIRRGGWDNVRQSVEAEALRKAGNADVLLEPQYVIESRRGLFGSKITRVAVSGRPAVYTNFRHLNDTVLAAAIYGNRNCCGRHTAEGSRTLIPAYDTQTERYSARKRGLAFLLSATGGYSQFKIEGGGIDRSWDKDWNAGLQGSIGYQFSPKLFAGVGVGANYLSNEYIDGVIVPYYVQGRYYFKNRERSGFFDLKVGSTFNFPGAEEEESHFYISPSIGYTFGNFEVALQYQMFSTENFDYDNYIDKAKVHNMNVTLGFRF